MPGIRLHPNDHDYALDLRAFAELLALSAKRRLIVQIALRMEDPRAQHPMMNVPDVDATPLVDVLCALRPVMKRSHFFAL